MALHPVHAALLAHLLGRPTGFGYGSFLNNALQAGRAGQMAGWNTIEGAIPPMSRDPFGIGFIPTSGLHGEMPLNHGFEGNIPPMRIPPGAYS